MNTKKKGSENAKPTSHADLVYLMLRICEKRGSWKDADGEFKPVTELEFYGFRPSDPMTINGVRTTFESYFQACCNKWNVHSINLNETLSLLVTQRRIGRFTPKAKQDSEKVKKGQKLGAKYWTMENERYLAKAGKQDRGLYAEIPDLNDTSF